METEKCFNQYHSSWTILLLSTILTSACMVMLYSFGTSIYQSQFINHVASRSNDSISTIINWTDVWYPNANLLNNLQSIPKRIELPKVDKYNQLIPRKIYQTWINNEFSGILMKEAVYSWLHLNPEYDYYFFNDFDCKQWILKYCGKRYLKAYLTINKLYGAARSDYFRYLIMWKWGGIYVDIDSKLTNPLREWIRPYDEFVISVGSLSTPCQWMLIAKQNHTIYRRLSLRVTEIIENHNKREYIRKYSVKTGRDILKVTGPFIFHNVYVNVLTETIKDRNDSEELVIRKMPIVAGNYWNGAFGGNVEYKNGEWNISKEMEQVRIYYQNIKNTKRKPNPFYVQVTESNLSSMILSLQQNQPNQW